MVRVYSAMFVLGIAWRDLPPLDMLRLSDSNACHLPAMEVGLEVPMRSAKPAMASETMLDLGRYHLAALAHDA
jgi:hypothetical protein